jgi:hypothetical protein
MDLPFDKEIDMSLQVIGAGLGRTGTASLKIALEYLLDGRCYHMTEVLKNSAHVRSWHGAALGYLPQWHTVFDGYAATVDWPAASFWPELVSRYPDAIVVLSIRDPESWWESARSTIFKIADSAELSEDWQVMFRSVTAARWTADFHNRQAAIEAFCRHNDNVIKTIPAHKLVVWHPRDGWGPLCAALRKPVPDHEFPHVNSRTEWSISDSATAQLELAGV